VWYDTSRDGSGNVEMVRFDGVMQLQRRSVMRDEDENKRSLPRSIIVNDRKRKTPVTSRLVTWDRDVLLANHCNPAPAISRIDDDDDDDGKGCDDDIDRASPTLGHI